MHNLNKTDVKKKEKKKCVFKMESLLIRSNYLHRFQSSMDFLNNTVRNEHDKN